MRTRMSRTILIVAVLVATVASADTDAQNREALFQQFCVTPGSVGKSLSALSASNRVGAKQVTRIGGTEYVSFAVGGLDRASVTVIDPPVGGLQCSVGIKNVGINLYSDGRIHRE